MNNIQPKKVFEIVDVKDELPECDSQHNTAFASNELFVICEDGSIDYAAYFKNGVHTSKGWEQTSEEWNVANVTHWLKETNDKYLLSKEELEKLLSKAYNDGMDYNADLLSSTYAELPKNGDEYINQILNK
jgi:hypothetical protein